MSQAFHISRRGFLGSAAAAALTTVYLPGIGRVQARPQVKDRAEDYQGRLCYNENPLGPSPQAQVARLAKPAFISAPIVSRTRLGSPVSMAPNTAPSATRASS